MADKKITQLPSLSFISGSTTGYYAGEVVLPIVHNSTTVKIEAQKFALYATQWSATTASNTFIGNQTVNGNVVITGKLTAQEMHTEITSASIIFESGSTLFGNTADDTHTFTGTINVNGKVVGNAPLDFTSQSLNVQTGSQELINLQISSVTGSMNTQSSSQNSVNYRNSTVTSSLNLATASLNFTTGALNIATGSYNRFYQVTASVHSTTASLNQATSSLNFASGALNIATGSYNRFYDMTSSVHFTTQSLNVQTGSQESINVRISSTTGSINTTTSSFDSVFLRISSVTGSMNTQSSSQDVVNFNNSKVTASIDAHILGIAIYTASVISQTNTIATFTSSINFATQSLNRQTGSQESINTTISVVTGSLIGITNGLMSWTASLDNTYATDAQLYQLYQATASVHFTTSSLNAQTGSQQNLNAQIGIVTGSLNSTTASLIAITNGLMALTASMKAAAIVSSSTQVQNYDVFALNSNLYNGTGSLQAQLNGIMAVTASMKNSTIVSSSQQIQNYDIFALNSNLYNSTGSIQSEINGIMALTASMKAAAIVSSSQQVQNYFTFARTGSANTVFYGNVTASGNLHANQLYIGGATTASGLFGASEAVVQNELGIQFGDATGTYMRLIANTANSNTAIVAGAFSGAQPPLDLIAGGITAISVKNDGGVNFAGSPTASIYKVNNGGGIDFSANSNAAGMTSELLNDYEEGTWTPTIVGGSTAGTCTYTARTAQYSKVGNCVHFRADIIWTGHNGSGLMSVTGLPFTIGSNYMSSVVTRFDQTTTASNYIGGAYIYITQIDMQVMPVGGGAPGNLNITAAGDLRVSGYYFVN